jgi:protein-tyrosine phosphatase
MDTIIKDVLYLSDYDASRNRDLLAQHKIRTIVNISDLHKSSHDLAYYDANGIEHIWLLCQDHEHENIDKYFVKMVQIMRRCPKPVLLHCYAGISRSATLVIAYLMESRNLPLKYAYTLVRRQRPRIRPNPGFLKQLKQWDIFLRYHIAPNPEAPIL